MRSRRRSAALTVAALAAVTWAALALRPAATVPSFAAQIERLSEPGGYFDTDNLISNEASYLEVIPALIAAGVAGGVYLGVGPDQNFSYIARIRPSMAYIIDIRRDNLLLHLLFKAVFAEARTPVEYLCLLTGRAPPAAPARDVQSIHAIVSYLDAAPLVADAAALERRLDRRVETFGVPLTAADYDTIHRFHRAFRHAGLDLQFQSHGRPPRPHYPTFRQLLLATDRQGHTWNFLASPDDYAFVRALQSRDRIVPVVRNLGGNRAMRAIAADVAEQGAQVTAVYVSNVPSYLRRALMLDRFRRNLALLPRGPHSVMIRSEFGGGSSVSSVGPIEDVLARAGR